MRKLLLAFVVLGLCACTPPAPAPARDAAVSVELVQDAGTVDSGTNGLCIVDGLYHLPNPTWTPGVVCTPSDPWFVGYRYPGHVAYCQRHITASEKNEVACLYGIPRSDYSKYEFDHFIPLSSGGSNDVHNLWPQPLAEAADKDRVEDQTYNGLRTGSMTQEQAVALIKAWRPATCH